MERRTYCVYNQTRECFLGLRIAPADTMWKRLKGLIGRIRLGYDEGIWVVPSRGIHTVGLVFPIDVIYLDENLLVVHLVEHVPAFRIAPLKAQAASVLQLPAHTIYSSQTQVGDKLEICRPDEMKHRLGSRTAVRVTR